MSTPLPDPRRLVGLAYRMLGSVQAAEDAVQDAFLRLQQAEDVVSPDAWLTTVVTRRCLDELKSARHQRETYPGPWLPEPWVEQTPADHAELAESLQIALLVVLERLSPEQRAAFLLHDVFDVDYDTIARTLGTTPSNARQLAHRARTHLATDSSRFQPDANTQARLLFAFGEACRTRDPSALAGLLHPDAVAFSDGGGERNAAKVPVVGTARIAKAYINLLRLLPRDVSFELAWVNGAPGLLTRCAGSVYSVLTLDVLDGQIVRIWSMLNPHKLRHLP